MRIIKFKKNEKFKYKRKVIIKDLILNISIGIHTFEKKKKQRVKINIEILTNPHVYPNNKNLVIALGITILLNEYVGNLLINKIEVAIKKAGTTIS